MPPHRSSQDMTEQEDPSRERLKNHFAQRVIHQARQILEIWQRLQGNEWSPPDLAELSEANQRLLRFAERFEQPEHSQLARAISDALQHIDANGGRLSSTLISDLNRLMQRLSRTGFAPRRSTGADVPAAAAQTRLHLVARP